MNDWQKICSAARRAAASAHAADMAVACRRGSAKCTCGLAIVFSFCFGGFQHSSSKRSTNLGIRDTWLFKSHRARPARHTDHLRSRGPVRNLITSGRARACALFSVVACLLKVVTSASRSFAALFTICRPWQCW